MYFLTVILIIAAILSVAYGNRFAFFTKERTYLLKALLPYIIFTKHSHLLDWDFRLAGAFVVSLFFFISGYGLETKRKNSLVIEKDFLTKALRKLIIPMIVPIIIYTCLRSYSDSFSVLFNEDIKKYQIILPYTWYVVTLIILYVLFYVSVIIANRRNELYFSLIVVFILLFYLIGRLVGIPGTAYHTTTAFIAGILFKNIEENIIRKFNSNIIAWILVSSMTLIFVTIWIQGNLLDNKDRPLTAFVWPIVFMVIYAVIPTCKENNILSGGIKHLSSISYELYICQAISFLILGEKSQYHPVVYLLSLFILCTIVAFGCKFLTCKISGWILK